MTKKRCWNEAWWPMSPGICIFLYRHFIMLPTGSKKSGKFDRGLISGAPPFYIYMHIAYACKRVSMETAY